MSIEVYMYFNGNCREAVEFYADVFGARIQKILTYGEAPSDPEYPISEEGKKRVLHTLLEINGSKVMFSDCQPGMPYITGNNVSITLNYSDKDEMKRAFDKLKEGGEVQMELGETFFSKYYGFLMDKFGFLWQFMYMEK